MNQRPECHRRSRGGYEEGEEEKEGDQITVNNMPPSKGRDSSVVLMNRDLSNRDLSQLHIPSSSWREPLPLATGSSKGKTGNHLGYRKGSSWNHWLGASWKSLMLSLVLLVLCGTLLIVSEVFNDQLGTDSLAGGLPGLSSFNVVEEQEDGVAHGRTGLRLVRDIVAFPDEVMLLVTTDPNTLKPDKNSLQCLFGGNERTGIYTIEWKDDAKTILAVRCQNPSLPVNETEFATLIFADSNVPLLTAVQNTSNSSWNPLVYETITLPDSVLLFAKGLVDSQGRPNNHSKVLDKLHCSFGGQYEDELGARLSIEVKTKVVVISQEVVRCELPPQDQIQQLKGLPVTLYVPKVGKFRTVAYFDIPERLMNPSKPDQNPQGQEKFFVCACTMLWNQADFLREWIMYHGFLGIEKWYLYDNNSDDDIEEVLGSLSNDYNVSRIPWPWIKTQEAGFSHCALRAKAECKWVLFADVDEFVYPSLDLHLVLSHTSQKGARNSINLARNQSLESLPKIAFPLTGNWDKKPSLEAMSNYIRKQNTSIIRTLIERTVTRGLRENKTVGEVRLVCHNFGPSNLVTAPEQGVTVGYTCRTKKAERHKSFVLLEAISDTLLNVVHHFKLADGYRQMPVHVRIAVINHYKYQVWEVFKAKFVRRVATYVTDWKSFNKTSFSHDVTPGLGTDAIEPEDWPSKFCEEEDHGLRNFTLTYFRNPESPEKMLWHLDGRITQLQKQRNREAEEQKSLPQAAR
ncbi:hypothetical protein R1sor_001906 [Riccia sorocarpa]|uniref:Glycosyltransferase family 92 protein n=1 Tax=Riccia sorocarpa TaxID=122646 RepID=A0ABD3H375_9MARC